MYFFKLPAHMSKIGLVLIVFDIFPHLPLKSAHRTHMSKLWLRQMKISCSPFLLPLLQSSVVS